MKLQHHVWFTTAALAAAAFVCSLNQAAAADNAAIDPTGTWKVTMFDPQTKRQIGWEETLKIRREGVSLTGTITHRSSVNGKERVYQSVIKEVKIQGNDLSFTFSHPPHVGKGPDITSNYEGKIIGDSIKGKIALEWDGHAFNRAWEAKRASG